MMNKLKIKTMRKVRKSLDVTVARLVRLEMQTIEEEKREEERKKDQNILKSCFEKSKYLFENKDESNDFEVYKKDGTKESVVYCLSLSGKFAEAKMKTESIGVQCLYPKKCTTYHFSGDRLLVDHLYIDRKKKELKELKIIQKKLKLKNFLAATVIQAVEF